MLNQEISYLSFFSSRRRHTISYGDWSSDVCSSDLAAPAIPRAPAWGGTAGSRSMRESSCDGDPGGRDLRTLPREPESELGASWVQAESSVPAPSTGYPPAAPSGAGAGASAGARVSSTRKVAPAPGVEMTPTRP